MIEKPKLPENYPESQLYRIRHSLAHIMAQAVMDIFPNTKIAIGPPVDDGFYYDFDLPRPITADDLEAIEKRMREILAEGHAFIREEITPEQARELFKDQPYKLELIEDILQRGTDEYGNPLPEGQQPVLSIYRHGNFVDLCRGPHVKHTREIHPKAFKLDSIAGAYWRGDETKPMLTRIYGFAWQTPKELRQYLQWREEAAKRDHRRLGKELGLFYFAPDEIGPGIPLFTPKGEILRHLLESFVREVQTRYGFQHVWTGNLVKENLYAKSGHLQNYADVMFPPMVDGEDRFRLKPMNCPSHMTLYKKMGKHSYRELPLRFSEFATVYRYEKKGELHGLTRVRSLTQDDCHIFCTPDQIQSEFTMLLDLIQEILGRFGLTDYQVRLSLRGEGGKYVNDPEKWNKAEAALRAALDASGLDYTEARGEAAFYGPKADFIAHDTLGREWQLSTIQVDFIQPARLGLTYIGPDGQEHTPVVLHRAIMGSTERFLGVLIEHYAGAFPVWLAPVQAVLIPIADRHVPYCNEVAQRLRAAGLRVEVDDRSERMNAKIRDAQRQKVPYMLVVGDKEVEARQVALRLRSGENLGPMSVEAFLEKAQADIDAGV
ncbi:MAG TPA: threonine--tRNA ligase [Anaerolineae bacterium]|nr:threonine--tRNA ligase [Anaerolineae bacterium]HID84491.1 threonine--tRNA ligase [Anaerolineales bacterium]HIQ08729.1 threonine--tRNA ligase [Anaerolineaceae bacterium]